jgi:glycerol-3-phosphate dehydrogenase
MSQSEGGRKIHIHGEKGVYHSGDWIDMDSYNAQVSALKEKIKAHQKKGACGETCATCPRSGSCHSSAKADGSYDVIIIGAGCIGASVARELSKTTARVLWLEAADDVSQGATKGNSGIVHAGFDDKPGSVRSKFCWKGNQMFPELDRQLNFGYQRNGSLVLATKPEEIKILEELKERGKANGVERLQILNKEELFKKEVCIFRNIIDLDIGLHSCDLNHATHIFNFYSCFSIF